MLLNFQTTINLHVPFLLVISGLLQFCQVFIKLSYSPLDVCLVFFIYLVIFYQNRAIFETLQNFRFR